MVARATRPSVRKVRGVCPFGRAGAASARNRCLRPAYRDVVEMPSSRYSGHQATSPVSSGTTPT